MSANKRIRPKIVLLVENEEKRLQSMKTQLENLNMGFEVLTATSKQAALECAKDRWIHLAVIDADLLGKTAFTHDGIDLATDSRFQTYARIIFTSYPLDSVNTMLSSRSHPLKNIDVKSKYEDKLEQFVPEVFSLNSNSPSCVGINFDQQLLYPPGDTRYCLVTLLRDAPTSGEKLEPWAAELEDIFGKTFAVFDVLRVSLLTAPQGRSGSMVLLVSPQERGSNGHAGVYWLQPQIVKCGNQASIAAEHANYGNYVTHYLRRHANLADNNIYTTLHLGMLTFNLTDYNVPVKPFADFYSEHDQALVEQAINSVFDAATLWYNHSLETTTGTLLHSYLERNVLFGSHSEIVDVGQDWKDLKPLIDDIASAVPEPVELRIDGTLWRWRFDDKPEITGEDPYAYLSGFREQQVRLPKLFSEPYIESICHGDLHGHNILVDSKAQAWMIDFEHTGPAPLILDPVELESTIRFTLLKEHDLYNLICFEYGLSKQEDLATTVAFPSDLTLHEGTELAKAIAAITAIRRIAARKMSGMRIADYYLGLVYHALRVVRRVQPLITSDFWSWSTDYSKFQSLFVASLYCKRLIDLELAL